MSDAFSKITAILLCVIMMFIIPVYYMQEEAKRLSQTYVLQIITAFVDGVRNTGVIGSDDYNRMEAELHAAGEGYSATLTHSSHEYEEDNKDIKYFSEEFYTQQIEDVLSAGSEYHLSKYDYLKAVVKNSDGDVIAWYGGSVRYEAY